MNALVWCSLGIALLIGLWFMRPSMLFRPPSSREPAGLHNATHKPVLLVEPDSTWTAKIAPIVRQLVSLQPDALYMWGPRLSDFLAVDKKYRGTEKGVADANRLRNYRVALVLMEKESLRPSFVFLLNTENNEVAKALLTRLGIEHAEVGVAKHSVAKALEGRLQPRAVDGHEKKPAKRPVKQPKPSAPAPAPEPVAPELFKQPVGTPPQPAASQEMLSLPEGFFD